MSNNVIGYLLQLLLVTGLMLAIYALIRSSLRKLLDHVLESDDGTTFYMRALLLLMLLAGLKKSVGDQWNYKADAAFMEYVWDVAGTIGEALAEAFVFLTIYVVLVTILTATLRRGSRS